MSDVEKAISGKDGNTNTTTTYNNTATAAALAAKTTTTTTATAAASGGVCNAALTTVATSTTAAATTTTIETTSIIERQNRQTALATQGNDTSWSRSCLSLLLKVLFSTPGLVLLVCAYSVLGALIFPLLEAPQDITKSAAIAKSREDCLRELWIITEKLNVLYERNWTMLVHEQLRRFEGSIVAATRQGVSAGGYASASSTSTGSATTALGRFGGNYDSGNGLESWSFSEALLYSVSVITTIGHGSLTPKTAAGKIATIFYALIGVPLMLMCLSSLGALLADALQCTYARLCCQLQASMGRGTGASGGGVDKTTHKRRCSLDNVIDGQSQNGLNCKNCKYDALSTETSLTNGYEYGSKRKLSLEHSEDACQLLRCNASSPAKLQHQQSSPCMQIKMAAPTAHAMQYYQQRQQQQLQQQQQQQHQQQQQPDVMLMTTTATNPMATPTMQQKFACTRSATSSPQHLQQQQQQSSHQQQQQQFYITTNATPTTLPRMHHQQQHQQHHQQQQSTQQQQQQQQQHFVAVPSSILRFSIANATPMPPNCYTTPTGAATIYFPIAASASSTNNMNAATAGVATASPMPTLPPPPQPLVKYHTIQLQPAATKRLLAAGDVIGDAAALSMPQAASAAATTTTTAATLSALDAMTVAPLPPPPAYQTATVHGIRRAKFLTKPLPHELTMLSNSGDASDGMSCRHDLLHNALTTTTATTAALPMPMPTTTTIADNTLIAAGVCGAVATPASTTLLSSAAAMTTATASTTITTNTANATTVDIMDEEDENEQQRLSNCPHGTPSRVPLIGSSKSHGAAVAAAAEAEKTASTQARSLLNATAASFHRHTLHTNAGGGGGGGGVGGQRGKSHLLLTRRGCQMHARSTLYDSAATTETDDDDEGEMYMQHGSEQFVLKKLKTKRHVARSCSAGGSSGCVTESELDGDYEEDDDDDADDDGVGHATQRFTGAQVPISIVLLILICYISVGTFIFAFWENWSLIDGAYFCFVTLSTIGYGDFAPTRTFQGPELQLYACCAYLLLGLVLVAMSFSILETQLMWKCKRIAVRLKLAKD